MYRIRQENSELLKRIAALEASEAALAAEKEQLESALGDADANSQALQLQIITGGVANARPKTAAEVIAEFEEGT